MVVDDDNGSKKNAHKHMSSVYKTAIYHENSQQTCGTEEEYVGLFQIVVHFVGNAALGFGGWRELRQVFRAQVVVDVVKQQSKVFAAETAYLSTRTP